MIFFFHEINKTSFKGDQLTGFHPKNLSQKIKD